MKHVLTELPQYMFSIEMLGEILASKVRPLSELKLASNYVSNELM